MLKLEATGSSFRSVGGHGGRHRGDGGLGGHTKFDVDAKTKLAALD